MNSQEKMPKMKEQKLLEEIKNLEEEIKKAEEDEISAKKIAQKNLEERQKKRSGYGTKVFIYPQKYIPSLKEKLYQLKLKLHELNPNYPKPENPDQPRNLLDYPVEKW